MALSHVGLGDDVHLRNIAAFGFYAKIKTLGSGITARRAVSMMVSRASPDADANATDSDKKHKGEYHTLGSLACERWVAF